MGLFSKRSRAGSWVKAARSALPPHDPLVRAYGEPGETFLPGLGVINWQKYMATLNQPERRRIVAESGRTLFLSDRRLLVSDESSGMIMPLPLEDVLRVELRKPPGKVWEWGEIAIRITVRTEVGTKAVDYATFRIDAEVFATKLRENAARWKLSQFRAQHGEVSIHSPEATQFLELMVEAGEAELPPILRDFKADTSNLTPPVTSWKQCPECGGLLSPKGDAALCPECTRVWCDPYRRPALDEDGHLLGAQPYAPSPTEIEQGMAGRVSAWFVTTQQR